jgi:hypothetical protein
VRPVSELSDEELNEKINVLRNNADYPALKYADDTDNALILFDGHSRHDLITRTEKGFLVQMGMRSSYVNRRNAMGISENERLSRAIAEAYYEANQ